MSVQVFSRGIVQGKVKAQKVTRNPVVRALAQRALSSAAGKHIRSQGAQRRADKVALGKLRCQQDG